MRVIDVVARAVGEHRVDEVGLDLGRLRAVAREPSGVAAGRLVFEVPADAVLLDVPVDQETRRDDRVRVRCAPERDAVLGLDADDLRDGHAGSLPAASGSAPLADNSSSTGRVSPVAGSTFDDVPVRQERSLDEQVRQRSRPRAQIATNIRYH